MNLRLWKGFHQVHAQRYQCGFKYKSQNGILIEFQNILQTVDRYSFPVGMEGLHSGGVLLFSTIISDTRVSKEAVLNLVFLNQDLFVKSLSH